MTVVVPPGGVSPAVIFFSRRLPSPCSPPCHPGCHYCGDLHRALRAFPAPTMYLSLPWASRPCRSRLCRHSPFPRVPLLGFVFFSDSFPVAGDCPTFANFHFPKIVSFPVLCLRSIFFRPGECCYFFRTSSRLPGMGPFWSSCFLDLCVLTPRSILLRPPLRPLFFCMRPIRSFRVGLVSMRRFRRLFFRFLGSSLVFPPTSLSYEPPLSCVCFFFGFVFFSLDVQELVSRRHPVSCAYFLLSPLFLGVFKGLVFFLTHCIGVFVRLYTPLPTVA